MHKHTKKAKTMVVDHLGNEYETQLKMCEAYEINERIFAARKKRGWDIKASLTTPIMRKTTRWTDEEIELVKKHYGQYGSNIPGLNRSPKAIIHLAERLNISTKRRTVWTKEDIKILKAKYPIYGTDIPELNKTRSAIQSKASSLRLKQDSRKWTNEELKLLKENYAIYGAEIPGLNRTRSSIITKAGKLGLKTQKGKWTDAETRIIKEKYPKYGINIPELSHKGKDNIIAKAASLGLKRKREYNDYLNKWMNNKCGLKCRVINIIQGRPIFEFEDGSTTSPSLRYTDVYRVSHPTLISKRYYSTGVFCGFTTRYIATDTSQEDWAAMYECECKQCGLKGILTPQQMMEHAKQHKKN